MSEKKFQLPERFRNKISNVWTTTPNLTSTTGPVNLAQGIPNFLPPPEFMECLSEAMKSRDVAMHQYGTSMGLGRLQVALAQMYKPTLGRDLDSEKEVMITLGAKEAIDSVLHGLVCPGDEVIVVEPFFTPYKSSVKAAGGKVVYVPLRQTQKAPEVGGSYGRSSSTWTLCPQELASKFSSRTKVIILNTPNNPVGKVYSREELSVVADLCKQHDVVVLADEVYEWMLYGGTEYIKMASLPGMWERTISVASAGKLLSATGWRIGWAIGPARLLDLAHTAHKTNIVVTATPMQLAVALCIELEVKRSGKPESYRNSLAAEVEENRDILARALSEAGMEHTVPQGGYFLVADFSCLASAKIDDRPPDMVLMERMADVMQLVGIPLENCYGDDNAHLGQNLVRLCIVKDRKTIQRAADNIRCLGKKAQQNGHK